MLRCYKYFTCYLLMNFSLILKQRLSPIDQRAVRRYQIFKRTHKKLANIDACSFVRLDGANPKKSDVDTAVCLLREGCVSVQSQSETIYLQKFLVVDTPPYIYLSYFNRQSLFPPTQSTELLLMPQIH